MGATSEAELASGGKIVANAASEGAVLRVKISLVGVSRPPVWRRLLVPADIRLDRFHEVIQAAMGWEDYHMHVFSTGAARPGRPGALSTNDATTLDEAFARVCA